MINGKRGYAAIGLIKTKNAPNVGGALRNVDDILDAKPYGARAVAVEIVDGAIPLPRFTHPSRAFYIFGPEDGSIPSDVIERCDHVVSIPSNFCLNLAAAVNVVLYDRMVKRGEYASTMKEALESKGE